MAFCATSSAIYIINDLVDREKDLLHPFKRHRPIASGKISQSLAFVSIAILVSLSLFLALTISFKFTGIIILFYLLQLSYSFQLKNIILLDILAIASGFIVRVFAGEVATGYHLNIWLFLTVISAALFLAVGKRRSELTLLSAWHGANLAKTRATLSHYSEKMLDVYLSMFANSTWITYAFYSFLERPPTIRKTIGTFFEENDLFALSERKWLMITIPIVLYGIMRYLQLIYEKNQGESPEKVLFSDRPLMLTAVVWGLTVFTIFYLFAK